METMHDKRKARTKQGKAETKDVKTGERKEMTRNMVEER
jgi:hypothetical protein